MQSRCAHLLDVALDVAQHVVGVQVLRQVADHVEAVAHIDERPAKSRPDRCQTSESRRPCTKAVPVTRAAVSTTPDTSLEKLSSSYHCRRVLKSHEPVVNEPTVRQAAWHP